MIYIYNSNWMNIHGIISNKPRGADSAPLAVSHNIGAPDTDPNIVQPSIYHMSYTIYIGMPYRISAQLYQS